MNNKVICNYRNLRPSLFYLPLLILISISLLLYIQDALNIHSYTQIQKDYFFFLNSKLSQLPSTQHNLTQLGDALIFFSFLTFFIVYAPRVWETLITASLVSLIFSCLLKKIFAVPRPAAVFDNNGFVIIGEKLSGHNSFPSGHSITVFTTLTVLMFAFIPKGMKYKCLWCVVAVFIGLVLVLTRIGVGAHHPLDVIVGSVIGYISGLLGIFINQKYSIWAWINNKKFYPVFIVLFSVCCFLLVNKIINHNLTIFYLSLASLAASLYIITNAYIKK